MKLKIEKSKTGMVRVEIATDTAKRPVAVNLTDADVDMLAALLQTAKAADAFAFQFER